MDYGAALEMRFGATRRGFESPPLRHSPSMFVCGFERDDIGLDVAAAERQEHRTCSQARTFRRRAAGEAGPWRLRARNLVTLGYRREQAAGPRLELAMSANAAHPSW